MLKKCEIIIVYAAYKIACPNPHSKFNFHSFQNPIIICPKYQYWCGAVLFPVFTIICLQEDFLPRYDRRGHRSILW